MKKRNMRPFSRLYEQSQSVRWIAMAAALALFAAACEDAVTLTPTTTTTVVADTSPQIQASTTTRTPASADLINLVTEAAAAACDDGLLTRQDLEGYRTRLRDLGVDPGSALSRTAAIVECGLTTEEALDRLP